MNKKKFPLSKFLIFWKKIPRKYQKQTFTILALTLIGTVLEMLGIGLIIPALVLLSEENISEKYPAFVPFINFIGNPSQIQLIIYGMVLLLVTYFIKSLYLLFLSWKQAEFTYGIKSYISLVLFEKYLRSSYEFHLKKNSANLMRNLTVEVQELINKVLNPAVLLVTELTVTLAIVAMFFFFEPVGALLLFIVTGVSIYLFQKVTKTHLQRWGLERQNQEGLRIQKAQEGLGGVKDVKLFGKEDSFIENYGIHNLNASLFEGRHRALSNTPRLWLELVGVTGLVILVLEAVRHGGSPSSVIPAIGLFAAAAFRILPSANRVLHSIQSLTYSEVVIDLITEELGSIDGGVSGQNKKLRFNQSIQLINISYTYPNSSSQSLHNISLAINKGESIGLMGMSGAGKSTVVDIILGLLKPTSGKVLIDGEDINCGLRSWQNLIGYVPQNIYLVDDTLKKNIAFGLKENEIDNDLLDEALKAAQIDGFVSTLSSGIDTFVGERGIRLSGGQRQRIGIARALYYNPPVLIFDEATSALDGDTEKGVMNAIRAFKGNRTVIIIAHRLSTVEHCDRIYRLVNGRLH